MANLIGQKLLRTSGIYLALAGAAIIALYILYWILDSVLNISTIVKIGVVLLLVGGILLVISIIRERTEDAKKETFRGTRQ
jgi:ABC-type enterobactin transport system permease subunit